MGRGLNTVQINQLRKLAPTHTMKEVAKVLGCTKHQVDYYARQFGVSFDYAGKKERLRKLTPEYVQFIKEAKGVYTGEELAKMYDVSVGTIWAIWQGGKNYGKYTSLSEM